MNTINLKGVECPYEILHQDRFGTATIRFHDQEKGPRIAIIKWNTGIDLTKGKGKDPVMGIASGFGFEYNQLFKNPYGQKLNPGDELGPVDAAIQVLDYINPDGYRVKATIYQKIDRFDAPDVFKYKINSDNNSMSEFKLYLKMGDWLDSATLDSTQFSEWVTVEMARLEREREARKRRK